MIERLRNMFRFNPDERFIAHRYQSSRLALAVGVLMMFIWTQYEWFVNHELRLDLFIILETWPKSWRFDRSCGKLS